MSADKLSLGRNLLELERKGSVRRIDGDRWSLTDKGIAEVENILGKENN
jgi:hypothetical protein